MSDSRSSDTGQPQGPPPLSGEAQPAPPAQAPPAGSTSLAPDGQAPSLESAPAQPEKKRSSFYWFRRNVMKRILAFAGRHKLAFTLLTLIALGVLFYLRPLLHPVALFVRTHLSVLAFAALLFGPLWLLLRKRSRLARSIGFVVALLIAAGLWFWGPVVHQYLALYYRYQTLEIIELNELPVTEHERIPPLNSIYTIARHKIADTESPTRPDFVRIGDSYRFTLAIEPAYEIRRRLEGVRQLFSLAATSPAPDFSNDRRASVHFETGEELLGNRNAATAAIRTLDPWRFFSYQPDGVIYITDAEGSWVQVVPWIRWRGIFFPRPEFGGVQVIRQSDPTLVSSARRMLIGTGEWIRPKDVPKHEYLVGQNILSYQTSRYFANSFRFQYGLLAPLPGYHRGDIRIPDLPEDMNDQPFTAFFKIPHPRGGSKLYHYFALEPFDPEKRGLNTSVFIPADGSSAVFVYKHHEMTGSPTGVSAIAPIIRESRKNYDWSTNRPVEHRPFIKDVGGDRRFFWLTTVVTVADGDRFTAGSVPDLVITDPMREIPVWVDSKRPDLWLEQLETEMASVWGPE